MDPLEIMAEYAAAWERGDPEAAFEFYADDVLMLLPGRGALAGEHRGREAVVKTINALLQRTSELTAEIEVLDRLVSEDRIAMVLRETVVREDQRLELRRVNVYRVVDGRIVEIDIYEANQYEVDAFFG
ncbi:MAG: nuclear transport factor 2 family protein [Acidimicrobiia bacterium]|nr:nuclear transport factor 2 family protein [Acidimicrobiia bacterium]